MVNKRSNFLTFCFAFLPGAGQMYMGFMKRGVSIMSAFSLLIFSSIWLNFIPLLFAIPVIWFFSFFDTINLRTLPEESLAAMEDCYIIFPELLKNKSYFLTGKYRTVFAIILIFCGVSVLLNNLYGMLGWILPTLLKNFLYSFSSYFFQLMVASGLIIFGIYLIVGKKKFMNFKDKFHLLEDKGDSE